MNYLIAGTLGQPENAFGFMLDELEGGITFVRFRDTGWSPKQMANDIICNAREHGYRVRVWTISVGDQVARFLEASGMIEDLEIVAINPCPNPSVVKPEVSSGVKAALLPAGVISAVSGWASTMRCLPLSEQYSLNLLWDQAYNIVYGRAPTVVSRTKAIIISEQDEFLSAEKIVEFFPGAFVVYIDTPHSDTIGSSKAYLEAIKIIKEQAPK